MSEIRRDHEYRAFDSGDIDRSLIGDGSHLVIFEGKPMRARHATAELITRALAERQRDGITKHAERLRYIRSCLESGNTPSKKAVRSAMTALRDVYRV